MMHVRLERSEGLRAKDVHPDAADAVTLGPFEWVQLTYSELRVSPEGDRLAYFAEAEGVWRLAHPDAAATTSYVRSLSKIDVRYPFSDVVVY